MYILFYKECATKTILTTVSFEQPFLTTCLVGTFLECTNPNHNPFILGTSCQAHLFRVMENNSCKEYPQGLLSNPEDYLCLTK
jgi:hypothetical protein